MSNNIYKMFDNVLKDMDNLPKHICFSIGSIWHIVFISIGGFGIYS